ncbi:hypothetical protein VNO80_15729 [Phaseolus coccineus]|uniref:Uncharacterized protein n=1 Tax=Phaseolus coccineus TaxID=3886 RepID=A0AAN9ML54_PHACN
METGIESEGPKVISKGLITAIQFSGVARHLGDHSCGRVKGTNEGSANQCARELQAEHSQVSTFSIREAEVKICSEA